MSKRKLYFLVYCVLVALVFGWLLGHRSTVPDIFEYSWAYLTFLLVVAAIFIAIPILIWAAKSMARDKPLTFYLIPIMASTILVYFLATLIFYHTRTYRYDPFLQNPPVEFRDLDEKVDSTFRILAMGGSTTRLSSYPSQAGKILSERYPHLNIEVLNAGAPFWTTKHSLINYVTYGDLLKADLVLIMHAINDLVRSCTPPEYSIGKYTDSWAHFYGSTIATAKAQSFEGFLFGKLWLGLVYELSGDGNKDFAVDAFRSITPYRKNLQRLVTHVRGSGAAIAFITQPSLYKSGLTSQEQRRIKFGPIFCSERHGMVTRRWPSPEAMRKAMAAFNKQVESVAEANDVYLIDAETQLEKNLDNFEDDVHHTEAGGRKLGQIVAREIIASRILETLMERGKATR